MIFKKLVSSVTFSMRLTTVDEGLVELIRVMTWYTPSSGNKHSKVKLASGAIISFKIVIFSYLANCYYPSLTNSSDENLFVGYLDWTWAESDHQCNNSHEISWWGLYCIGNDLSTLNVKRTVKWESKWTWLNSISHIVYLATPNDIVIILP